MVGASLRNSVSRGAALSWSSVSEVGSASRCCAMDDDSGCWSSDEEDASAGESRSEGPEKRKVSGDPQSIRTRTSSICSR